MLCYAWDHFNKGSEIDLDWESMETLDDLLCMLMIELVDDLRKRGFHREYRSEKGELSTVRGRIDILESSKPSMKLKKRVVCEYDEYDMDNRFNRILISTISSMYRCSEDRRTKKELSRLIPYFVNVTRIRVTGDSFHSLIYDRNNVTYRLLMGICELYWSDKMTDESKGKHHFISLSEDSRMERIYEKFLLNFYKAKRKDLEVKSDLFRWKLCGDAPYPELLETLQTDIVLKDKANRKMLIIDAKYYRDTLVTNHGKATVRNSHVAQVYAYMMNHQDSGSYSVQGMLIYPFSGKEVHSTFPLDRGDITVHTVNLGKEWNLIEEELLSFLEVL